MVGIVHQPDHTGTGGGQGTVNLLNILKVSGSALTAQRLRMDVIASNIANAETTRTPEGGPYRRQTVVFRPLALDQEVGTQTAPSSAAVASGLEIASIVELPGDGRTVFDPAHPDADPNGFVTYPEIDMVMEMTDLVAATRAYEANVAVLQAIKAMAQRTLDIIR